MWGLPSMKSRIWRKYAVNLFLMMNLVFPILVTSQTFENQNIASKIFSNQDTNFNTAIDDSQMKELDHFAISLIKYTYNPIVDQRGSGDSFTINEELSVNHADNLTILSSGSDSYNIEDPSPEYSSDSMQYNITSIETTTEQITFEDLGNKVRDLDSIISLRAHSFTVPYTYAVFSGAWIYLSQFGGSYGADELKLSLVEEDISGFPNMTNILSNELGGPYNSSIIIPDSSTGNPAYYDFEDVVLNSGVTYFIVAELTTVDGDDDSGFTLYAKISSIYLNSYYYDGVWNGPNADNHGLIFKMELMQSDVAGNPITYSDPTTINLQDNGVPITSLTQTISASGSHSLTSNESVDVRFVNNYNFSRTFQAPSSFMALNSTHSSYAILWDLAWSLPALNLDSLSYSNPVRNQYLMTPSDWKDIDFTTTINDSISIPTIRTSSGYSLSLDLIKSGNNFLGGDMNFTTYSPNYIYDYILSDDVVETNEFVLGYWTTNETHAIGYNGSIVNADIFVKDSSLTDILSGNTNFTLFDPNGEIVAIKNESDYTNIAFTDKTSYTIIEVSQFSAGRYTVSTVFDPSINGTDLEGDWTAVCLWQNGSEVGFYSLKISVSKSTTASFSWEETLGMNDFTNSSISLNRINKESVKVQILYSNISDSFYSGEGTPITAAPVAYNTSWGSSGLLNYVAPYYEIEILIDAVVGNYSITLTASGQSLGTHTITFDIRVYHTFEINSSSEGYFQAYYNDTESYVQFTVEDTSNSSANSFVIPDEMAFYLDDVLLVKQTEYNVREFAVTNLLQLELFSGSSGLDLLPGFYSIRISVAKQDFIVDYGQENATTTVDLEILTTPTTIDIVSSDDEVYLGNETTITFYYVDTIHTYNIEEASVDITLDLDPADAEIIGTPSGTLGLYSVTVRIHDPQETSINIFLSISKPGYETKSDQLIKSISIINPEEGIPIYIFVIIGIFALVAMVTPLTVFIRRKLDKDRRAEKALFARIYGLYESVLSITKLIIVHSATGLPVYEMDLGSEISLDPSLITGFLTAIASMGVELRGDKTGSVKRLQYRDFLVAGSESGQFTLYTFSETDLNEEIEEKLTVISDWFAKMFSNISEEWDGSTEVFRINLQGITEKIMKEIHLWIFYPFTVSPYKQAEIEEFNGLQKRLIEYITAGDNVTISRIFDELDDVKIEKGLPIIFEFIENGILIPFFDAYKIATVRF